MKLVHVPVKKMEYGDIGWKPNLVHGCGRKVRQMAWMLEQEDPDRPGCGNGKFLTHIPTMKDGDDFYKYSIADLAIRFSREQDAEMVGRSIPFVLSLIPKSCSYFHKERVNGNGSTGTETDHEYLSHPVYGLVKSLDPVESMSPTPGQVEIKVGDYFDPEWTRAEKFDIWVCNVKWHLRRLFALRVKIYFKDWD